MRAAAISVIVLASVLVTLAQITPPDIADLKTKAAAGDVQAQVALAHAYEDGAGVPQNDQQAAKWYRAAADQGDAQAQNDLGVMYRVGHGVKKDFAEAMKWYRSAARQANASAMFNLGAMYYNGDGVAVDETSAYAWFMLASKAGSKQAADGVRRLTAEASAWKLRDSRLRLAEMVIKGDEVPQNVAAGISMYETMAQEYPVAWLRLAKIYLNDVVVPHDYSRAGAYCSKAAGAKLSAGMVCLGYLNAEGLLGPRNEKEALTWYDKAVHLGNPVAAFGMGVLYASGLGPNKDLERSFVFLLLAQEARIGQATPLLDSIGAQLDPKTIKKLKQKALQQRSNLRIHPLSPDDLEFAIVPPVTN